MGVERRSLSMGDDVYGGSTLSEIVEGQAGNDTITGGGGTDIIDGGSGSDTYRFSGGGSANILDASGVDTLDGSNSTTSVTIDLRTGKTSRINGTAVTIGGAASAGYQPLDLFFLEDLSGSFGDDIDTIRSVVPEILGAVRSIQSDTLFGAGSFVDRPEYSGSGDYVYKTEQVLSGNGTTLQATIDSMTIQYGGDWEEAQLSALLAVAQGTSGLGFRSDSARIVLLSTDAGYHVGGAYPTVAAVRDAVQAAGLIPVFAVTAGVLDVYQDLAAQLGVGAAVALDSNSSNIVDVIRSVMNLGGAATVENAIGGKANDSLIGNDAANLLDGGAGNDTLDGGAGNDTLLGGAGNDTLRGGAGADVIGGGENPSGIILGRTKDYDVALFEGSAKDYDIDDSDVLTSGQITLTKNGVTDVVKADVEKIKFESFGAANVTYDDYFVEMARGAAAAYAHAHLNIPEGTSAEDAQKMRDTAAQRDELIDHGWRPLAAQELGLQPKGDQTEYGVDYTMENGVYEAEGLLDDIVSSDWSEGAGAAVYAGMVDGKKTLMLTFRGTDAGEDWLDYVNFANHFKRFAPLNDAIKAYISEYGVEKIFVSGHSLGGAMAQMFMQQAGVKGDSRFTAVTFGNPGAQVANYDMRQFDFSMTQDLVPIAGNVASKIIGKNYEQAGTVVRLSSDISSIIDLEEHSKFSYIGYMKELASKSGDILLDFLASPISRIKTKTTYWVGSDSDGTVNGDIIAVTGKPFNDGRERLIGTSGADVINGYGSADTLEGGAGADTLNGDWGTDLFIGTATELNGDFIDDWSGGETIRVRNANFTLADVEFDRNIVADSKLYIDINHDGNSDVTITLGGWFTSSSLTVTRNGNDTDITYKGDVHLTASGDGGAMLAGGAGNDTITGGGGDDWLSGDAGKDVITAGAGADSIVGGSGEGDDTYDGGDGVDTVIYTSSSKGITVNLTTGKASGSEIGNDLLTGIEDVVGGTGGDRITGDSGTNLLYGHDGNDTLFGLDGDDTLLGGSGTDSLNGGIGADSLDGGLGADRMEGGAGDDFYYVDDAKDVVVEAAAGGTDTVSASISVTLATNVEKLILTGSDNLNGTGNAGNNVLTGNEGDNVLAGGSGADSLVGGGGNDTASYASSASAVTVNLATGTTSGGDAAGDVLSAIANLLGSAFADTLSGNDNANSLTGGAGNDTLTGGGGNDILIGGAGADTMTGGDGIDTVSYETSAAAVVIDLGLSTAQTGTGDAKGDVLASIENVTGTRLTDRLVGDGGANILDGGAGNDELVSGGGADTLIGGAGNDIFRVQGSDVTVVETATGGIDVVHANTSAFTLAANLETLIFAGTGDFAGTGNGSANTLLGGAGNDTLDGGTGADRMEGKLGNDIYVVDNAADVVVELAGGGTDLVRASVSTILAANVENGTLLGSDTLNLTGNAQNNVLTGNAGRNTLTGGEGADTLDGGDGVDTASYITSKIGVTVDLSLTTSQAGKGDATGDVLSAIENLQGSAQADTLTGDGTANTLSGEGGNDTLRGGGGDDTLSGGVGADVLDGGDGRNTADYSSSKSAVVVNLSIATAQTGGDAAGDRLVNIANLIGSNAGDRLTGDNGDNILQGLGGNDTLDGGSGTDTLDGGDGNDTYVITGLDDVIQEAATGGIDTVTTVLTSYTLSTNLENLTFTGGGAAILTGNSASNVLTGGGGNDTLDGGAGADTLVGGAGNDTLDGGAGVDGLSGGVGDDVYVVDNARDTVFELAKAGYDVVRASVSYTLTQNVEELALVGEDYLNGTGNEGDNKITGNSVTNTLTGGGGNDILVALGGNDLLIGGAGADTLDGGSGTDTVNYAASSAGIVLDLTLATAQGGGGDAKGDVLIAVENVVGTRLADRLLGGSGVNVLDGGAGNDELISGGGADTLIGGAGNDIYRIDGAAVTIVEVAAGGMDKVFTSASSWTIASGIEVVEYTGSGNFAVTSNAYYVSETLIGGAGNDTLDAGSGTDRMEGKGGNDIYYVDDAKDVVVELANGGIDEIRSTISLTLASTIENGTLLGYNNLLLAGNAANNVLTGNYGNNTLSGGAGNDTLDGGSGTDTASYADAASAVTVSLAVSGAQDTRGAGIDILANIENLAGSKLNDVLTGNTGANILDGGAGNDTLIGGSGSDTLIGGAGSDTFYFTTPSDGGDIIIDFVQGTDKIALYSPNFGGITSAALTAGAFTLNSMTLSGPTLVFNTSTKILSYDADGVGAGSAVTIATLTAKTLSAKDFTIIAS